MGRIRVRCLAGAAATVALAVGTTLVPAVADGAPRADELDTANADRCDFLDPSVCLYPCPNDHFTVADEDTPTGRRLALNLQSMPRNRAGKPIDPTDQNRADGFSPGNMIVTRVPGLDNQAGLRRTGAVPITDMARSFDPDQPVVVINARTRERQLIWAEIDSNPANPEDVTLIVRPGRNFDEGERYIVALRRHARRERQRARSRARSSAPIATTCARRTPTSRRAARTSRRSSRRSATPASGARDLYLAWDFTVASRAEPHRPRGEHPRRRLRPARRHRPRRPPGAGQRRPSFVQNPDLPDDLPDEQGGDAGRLPRVRDAREHRPPRITGNITVPCYLDMGCQPGGGFVLGPDGKPSEDRGDHAPT